MKRMTIGILAHVDAGKTTLSEGILYTTGKIRKLGRVDNRDAYLDTYELERARGITIFSKQAVFPLGEMSVTLLDTPGHVDFSAEMERTLQVLDLAVLVISGADGVQGHTETLWRLLKRYGIPTFLFVNKMDQAGTDREALLAEVRRRLDEGCVDMEVLDRTCDPMDVTGGSGESVPDAWWEQAAMCDEAALEQYLEHGYVKQDSIRRMIAERKLFPCYFGSALKLQGVEELLQGIERWEVCPEYPAEFGAKVFKISRDEQGNRLTHMKITGGSLKVRDLLPGEDTEKINQIRIYSGAKSEAVSEAEAGTICAVTGPLLTHPGQGLGIEEASELPLLEPVLTYRILLPEDCDVHKMLQNLRQLEEEEPQLHIVWKEALEEIQAQVMGEVQIEILKSLIAERFGVDVEFGTGNIVYKETILNTVEGVGHFEPLRHYAEVHLLMEPGEPGSGLQFGTRCSEDVLDRNWQRLILTHLEERRHVGVLMGAELTDVEITLVSGRAHQKHTEGGDFRQSTYRAVRQGLMQAQCRVLEPYYSFRLELPQENVGRAMADIERMFGTFEGPEPDGDRMVLTGSAPVACMQDYQREVVSYSKGRGRLVCSLKGYEACHNQEEVLAASTYDPEADLENPTGSVFCAHGAGFVVPWYEVKDYMHLEGVKLDAEDADGTGTVGGGGTAAGRNTAGDRANPTGGRFGSMTESGGRGQSPVFGADEKELEAIFTRTYGENKRKISGNQGPRQVVYREATGRSSRPGSGAGHGHFGGNSGSPQYVTGMGTPGYFGKGSAAEEEYLLVDGYNILYAWEELRELMKVTVDGARHRLMDILCNYQGYRNCQLIVVFDAYKVSGGIGSAQDYHNIHVIYTKEAETADQYIEKFAHQMGRKYRVTVATSDGLEQLIIRGQGCMLMSAADLFEDINRVGRLIEEEQGRMPKPGKNYLFRDVEADLAEYLERIRLGQDADQSDKQGK